MAHEIIMPKAGMSMEEGKVIKWFKKEGDAVCKGELLLEIETDKVNMEIEADESGYLLKILANEGDAVPVIQVIGYIGEKNEAVEQEGVKTQSLAAEPLAAKASSENKGKMLIREMDKIPATPLAKMLAAKKGILLDTVKPSGKHGEILARDLDMAEHISATPIAKKIAQEQGLPLSAVAGSGVKGKIFKGDILDAIEQSTKVPEKPKGAVLTGMRKVIAQRMSKSHAEVPPVTLNTRADVTELSIMRTRLNEKLKLHITFNDFIIRVSAQAFKEMPEMNVSYADNEIIQNTGIHIGVAVAMQNGLIVPVLRNTDRLTLREISQNAKMLAEKARTGGLVPDDYSGGTFTISNLGMYGIRSFTPIINQPESMILGVCAIEPSLVMDDAGKIEKRLFMGLSLTFDHRCVDGAQGAVFLKRIVNYLEDPAELLL